MPASARGCWQVIWEGMEEQVEASVVGTGTAPAGAGGCPTVFRLHREVWDGGAQGWYHSALCPPCRSVDMPKPAACQRRGDSPGDGTSQALWPLTAITAWQRVFHWQHSARCWSPFLTQGASRKQSRSISASFSALPYAAEPSVCSAIAKEQSRRAIRQWV